MNDDNQEINFDEIAEGLQAKVSKNKEDSQETIGQVAPSVSGNTAKSAGAGAEDIFSDTELEKPAVLQPKQPGLEVYSEEAPPRNNRKLILLIVVLLIFLAILVGVFFGYKYFVSKNGKIPSLTKIVNQVENKITPVTQVNQTANVNQATGSDDKATNQAKTIVPVDVNSINKDVLDTDGDGVPDTEEIKRGMNINSNDSDNDGLNDREEIMVYHTDPLNPDTDGDGFTDGDEVKKGYNPNGPGKLLDINSVKK